MPRKGGALRRLDQSFSEEGAGQSQGHCIPDTLLHIALILELSG